MEKKKRDAFARELKNILDDGSFGVNQDFQALVKQASEHPECIMDENDFFNFDNDACLKRCNGWCCSYTEIIRVSPVDVDTMLESSAFKGQERENFVLKNLNIFPGGESLIPMATIKFIEINKNLKICPFSVHFISRDGKKTISIKGSCILGQQNKPGICSLFPLGRMKLPGNGKILMRIIGFIYR